MSSNPASSPRLVPKLVAAVLIKLMLLGGIWWWFVRDQRVEVDGAAAASQVLGAPPSSGEGRVPSPTPSPSSSSTTTFTSPTEPTR